MPSGLTTRGGAVAAHRASAAARAARRPGPVPTRSAHARSASAAAARAAAGQRSPADALRGNAPTPSSTAIDSTRRAAVVLPPKRTPERTASSTCASAASTASPVRARMRAAMEHAASSARAYESPRARESAGRAQASDVATPASSCGESARAPARSNAAWGSAPSLSRRRAATASSSAVSAATTRARVAARAAATHSGGIAAASTRGSDASAARAGAHPSSPMSASIPSATRSGSLPLQQSARYCSSFDSSARSPPATCPACLPRAARSSHPSRHIVSAPPILRRSSSKNAAKSTGTPPARSSPAAGASSAHSAAAAAAAPHAGTTAETASRRASRARVAMPPAAPLAGRVCAPCAQSSPTGRAWAGPPAPPWCLHSRTRQVSAVRRRRAARKHAHARAPNISCERSARDAPPVHLSPMERTMRRWLSRVPMTDLRSCTSSVCAPAPIAPRPGGRARALAARAGLGRLELRSEAPGNDTRGAQGTAARRAGCLHRRAPGARCGAPTRPNFFFLRALHESVRVVARAIAAASLKTCLVGRDLRAPAHHTLADNAEGVFNGCSCGRGAS